MRICAHLPREVGQAEAVAEEIRGDVVREQEAEYAAALEAKVRSVAQLRGAVKDAALSDARRRELQGVIQAHFKDWLLHSGNMRQVFDLARQENGEGR